VFQIPEEHPQGFYWYHIHRHGSASVQTWQGMAGLLFVNGPESPEVELAAQGITRMEPMGMWQWKVDRTKTLADQGKPNVSSELSNIAIVDQS
jgi:FtsP/CotA-like multicopper oxidase with cupredoxin domain